VPPETRIVPQESCQRSAERKRRACGGDYEDPERTAWGPDAINDYEDDDNRTAEMMEEEFPAEK
jgi:hypothetical protein